MFKIMRKLLVVLVFTLVGTFAFANTDLNKVESKENIKTETLVNGDFMSYTIVIDEFDICTVTVTVTRADGRKFSVTASNNQGNCKAAEFAALDEAMLLAVIMY